MIISIPYDVIFSIYIMHSKFFYIKRWHDAVSSILWCSEFQWRFFFILFLSISSFFIFHTFGKFHLMMWWVPLHDAVSPWHDAVSSMTWCSDFHNKMQWVPSHFKMSNLPWCGAFNFMMQWVPLIWCRGINNVKQWVPSHYEMSSITWCGEFHDIMRWVQ